MDKQQTNQFTLPGPMIGAWRKTALHFAKKGSLKGKLEGNPEGPTDPRHQVQALIKQNIKMIAEIWEVFNQDRQDLSKLLLTTEHASNAYLLGFHLPNTARAMAILDRCLDRYPSLSKALMAPPRGTGAETTKPTNQIYWSDFGCGTGAMAQAATYWLESMAPSASALKIQVDLVDMGNHLLKTAKFLIETQSPQAIVKTHKFSLDTLRPPDQSSTQDQATLSNLYGVSLGYVWNELQRNPRAKAKLGQLLQSYVTQKRRALVVLLDPATEAMARTAMQWRDQLSEWGYVPLYPCPQIKLCPMNPRPRDWCYSEIEWQQPPEAKQLDQLLGSGRHRLATAAYVFASPALFKEMTQPQVSTQVVVGRPHVVQKLKSDQKSKSPPPFQYLLCTPQGLGYAQPNQQPLVASRSSRNETETIAAASKTPPTTKPTNQFHLRGTVLDEMPTSLKKSLGSNPP